MKTVHHILAGSISMRSRKSRDGKGRDMFLSYDISENGNRIHSFTDMPEGVVFSIYVEEADK